MFVLITASVTNMKHLPNKQKYLQVRSEFFVRSSQYSRHTSCDMHVSIVLLHVGDVLRSPLCPTFSPIRLKSFRTEHGVRFQSWEEFKITVVVWLLAASLSVRTATKVGLRGVCCIKMRWQNVTVYRMCERRCYVLWSCIKKWEHITVLQWRT